MEMPKLEDGPLKDKLDALYKSFDTEGKGMLDIQKLKSVRVEIGPAKASVFQTLVDMDINSDGYVEKSEWDLYFGAVSASLSPEELDLIIADLTEAARCAREASAPAVFGSRTAPRASLLGGVHPPRALPCDSRAAPRVRMQHPEDDHGAHGYCSWSPGRAHGRRGGRRGRRGDARRDGAPRGAEGDRR